MARHATKHRPYLDGRLASFGLLSMRSPYLTTLLSKENPSVRQHLSQNSVLFVVGGIVSESRRITVYLDSGYATEATDEYAASVDVYALTATVAEQLPTADFRKIKSLADLVWWNGAWPTASLPAKFQASI